MTTTSDAPGTRSRGFGPPPNPLEVVVRAFERHKLRGLFRGVGEGLRFLLVFLVRARESFGVLSHVLIPRWDCVQLDELTGRLPVAEEAPLCCPSAQARQPHARHGA